MYTGYLVVPENLNAYDAAVTGSFRDQAGNQATTKQAETKLTIQTPPLPVQLSATATDTMTVTVTWTRTSSTDFLTYLVCSSATSTVALTDQVASITNIGQQTYTDATLTPGETRYYRVFVKNFSGLTTGSATVQVTTPLASGVRPAGTEGSNSRSSAANP